LKQGIPQESAETEAQSRKKGWLKLGLYFLVLICASIGIFYLFHRLGFPGGGFAPTAYLAVFGLSVLNSALIGVPVPLSMATMIAVAAEGDLVLTALVGAVGGTLGELTAYYAGYLGKRIVHLENTPGYRRLVGWMERHGPWGIFLIALQPILPVDIAGFLAGVSRLPLWKLLVPCLAGKFPKYLLVCFVGEAFLRLLPPFPL
jgi:membrane protein YqaA with SNARE-associated domain